MIVTSYLLLMEQGDIVRLGNGRKTHFLMCGDASNPEDVKRLLGSIKVDSLVTDPPYQVNYGLKDLDVRRGLVKNGVRENALNNYHPMKMMGDDKESDFYNFLELVPFQEYNTAYVFCVTSNMHNLLDAFDVSHMHLHSVLVWLKQSPVFGHSDYLPIHEFILYGWKGKHRRYEGKPSTTVLRYKRSTRGNRWHPAQKPPKLMRQIISQACPENHIVYDPFAGSGSTLIACDQLNRRCYAMEIDPKRCDAIIERFEWRKCHYDPMDA